MLEIVILVTVTVTVAVIAVIVDLGACYESKLEI